MFLFWVCRLFRFPFELHRFTNSTKMKKIVNNQKGKHRKRNTNQLKEKKFEKFKKLIVGQVLGGPRFQFLAWSFQCLLEVFFFSKKKALLHVPPFFSFFDIWNPPNLLIVLDRNQCVIAVSKVCNDFVCEIYILQAKQQGPLHTLLTL